eukprot:TRINITY_DN90370_c0_g1_i1.p1 TRINITY_DN90370_c0_g1~~TRINITY_DN90370_c0_g1_i1.p1  ORF type:complete len:578 (-),score=121.80 TRINITY_DN90370_c0_g1_i1:25-1758(-)
MAILSALPLDESGIVTCPPMGSYMKEVMGAEIDEKDDSAEEAGIDNAQGQRRQQLLEALSSELSSLTEACNFSWRRPSNTQPDVGTAALKHQETLDEMRQRMAAAMRADAPREKTQGQTMWEPKQFQDVSSRRVEGTNVRAVDLDSSTSTGFFADLDGLRDRIHQRNLSSRQCLHSTSSVTLPGRDTQGQLKDECADGQTIDPKPQQLFQHDQQSVQPPREHLFQELRSTQQESCVRIESGSVEHAEALPELKPERDFIRADNVVHGETTPCHKMLQAEASLDELSRGDELLRWAEEVLRQAKAAEVASCKTPDQYCTDSLPNRLREPRGARKGAAAEFASAPQKRTEDFRDAMNRMAEEAESECHRLSAAGEERRRDFAARQENWKNRMDSAFEEMRKDFARAASPFRRPVPPSQPPPQRPKPRPAAGRQTSRPPSAGRQHYPENTACHDGTRRQDTRERAEDDAWKQLEDSLAEGQTGPPIHFEDIPWPSDDRRSSDFRGKTGISGVTPRDSAAVAKQLLTRALRRWHPDKWRRILDRVPASEQAAVMERVKGVAQRLLKEKAELTAPGGILYQS